MSSASEELRFQTIINATSDAMIIIDQEGLIRFVNRAAEMLFDRSSDELLNSMFGFPVVAGETTELDIIRKQGGLAIAEMRVTSIMWDGDIAYLASLRDITERVQAKNELQALYNAISYLFRLDSLSNLGYQIVQSVVKEFKHVDCGLMLVDKKQNRMQRLARTGEYRVETVAPLLLDGTSLVAQCVKFGKIVYSPDVISDPSYSPNNPNTRSELVIPLKTTKGTLGVLDLQSTQPNAFSPQDQRILAVFAERAAATIEIMQLYEKINQHAIELEWKVATRTTALLRSKERAEAILNSTGDALILVAADGTIEQTNTAFDKLFGYEPDEKFGTYLATLLEFTDSQLLMETFLRVMNENKLIRIEVNPRRKDGTPFVAEMSLAPIVQADSLELSVICSLRDITERSRMEAGLLNALVKEKELSELKTRLVSMASHEFRTPLTAIMFSAEILELYRDKLDDEKIDRKLHNIMDQVQHLTMIIDEVLSLSKMQAGKFQFAPELFDLDELCRDLIENFQDQQSITHEILYICKRSPFVVNLDKRLLQQVINNLVSNAIKYSPSGKQVFIHLDLVEEMIFIQIEDQGIGIPSSDMQHLFEPFHRAANVGSISGTGLGLSITKEAIERHGGTISVESEVDKGTIFTIKIPQGNTRSDQAR